MRYEKLGYVALNVADVERSRAFYVDKVGLAFAGTGSEGEAYLRCSHDHHNLVLYPSANPGLKRVGIEMQDEAAVHELAAKLTGHGVASVQLTDAESRARRQSCTLRFSEPVTGATYEAYAAIDQFGGQPYAPTHTKIQRLGHVVLTTPDPAKTIAFHTDVLELRMSDAIGDRASFMRLHPNPYHHGIGIVTGSKTLLHHVNFMVSEVDDIGKAIARFAKAQIPIVNGPGRHPASGSMFLYFLDPDEITLEYSFGMEEFPPEGARKSRTLEPSRASSDYWDSFLDAKRKGAVGAIETFNPQPRLTP